MKKAIRIVSLTLVVVMLAALLVSCGPSGSFGGDGYTVKFSGSKVTVTWKGALSTYTISGSFKMGKRCAAVIAQRAFHSGKRSMSCTAVIYRQNVFNFRIKFDSL